MKPRCWAAQSDYQEAQKEKCGLSPHSPWALFKKWHGISTNYFRLLHYNLFFYWPDWQMSSPTILDSDLKLCNICVPHKFGPVEEKSDLCRDTDACPAWCAQSLHTTVSYHNTAEYLRFLTISLAHFTPQYNSPILRDFTAAIHHMAWENLCHSFQCFQCMARATFARAIPPI